MWSQPLPENWTLRLADAPADAAVPAAVRGRGVPATVPGCVHTDLLAAGLIEDPYLGLNELDTHWIADCGWAYETELPIPAEALRRNRIDLCFDGLDTAAEVLLNGVSLGTAENMHVRHRFDARPAAREGVNTLTVRFTSPLAAARAMEERVGPRPLVGAGANARQLPHNAIRKMACNFGWDWGPELVTCGIWREARLEAWSGERLGDVRPLVRSVADDEATVEVHADAEAEGGGSAAPTLRLSLFDPEGRLVARESGPAPVTLRVRDPQCWWPVGHGEQPLYRLEVEPLDADGVGGPTRSHRIGLRTVELETLADGDGPLAPGVEGLEAGESMALVVNGRRLFCKGANWIPDDCFPHRVTPGRVAARIDQAVDAHLNMLRVWGGGLYESEAFYDACDERGVMVWQDFLMACATYAEEQPMRGLVEAEARDNVARLCPHPSLVIWNGCNENFWAQRDWPEFEAVRGDDAPTWGAGYYLGLFPDTVAELDPTRPYWPGSPWSGSIDRHPLENARGNVHLWDVWNKGGDFRNYLGHAPRFASEFGYQGPPTWPTLERAIPEGERSWLSETSRHHNKQIEGQERALARIADRFEVPESHEDVWFLASIGQARALELGCTWFRSLWPYCAGTLFWQWNDCWPVTSWAAVDGDGRPKMLWHATQRFYRPRLLAVLPAAVTPGAAEPDCLAACLHNDTGEAWGGTLRVRLVGFDGETIEEETREVSVDPWGGLRVPLPEQWAGGSDRFVVAEIEGAPAADRGWWFFGDDRDVDWPDPSLEAELLPASADTQTLRVTAGALAREVCLLVDRLDPDARVDRQRVNLLPGESADFAITGARPLTLDELSAPSVLRDTGRVVRATAATPAATA